MKLYSDEHNSVIYVEGRSPFLLITFSPMNSVVDGFYFWGRSFAEKTGICTVGVVAHKPDWYPPSRMESVFPILEKVKKEFSEVVIYGQSMGAYAALKYSALLSAGTCIALAPQYTINPANKLHSKRFAKYYSPLLHVDMEIVESDICDNAYVFYDPYFIDDRVTASALKAVAAELHMVGVRRGGHELTRVFASTPAGRRLIDLCRRGKLDDLFDFVTLTRRSSPTRARMIVEALAGKNLSLAWQIYQVRCASCTPSEKLTTLRILQKVAAHQEDCDLREEIERSLAVGNVGSP